MSAKRIDFSRTAGARTRTLSRRMQRRVKIAARFFPNAFAVEA